MAESFRGETFSPASAWHQGGKPFAFYKLCEVVALLHTLADEEDARLSPLPALGGSARWRTRRPAATGLRLQGRRDDDPRCDSVSAMTKGAR